jgi:hypothetical protein
MGRNFFAASRTTPPPGFEDYQPLRRRWREIDEAMQGAFPPTALFASEIAGAVDRYLVDRIDWAMRNHQSVAAPAQDMPMTGTGGPLGRVFGRRAPSPPPPPPPLRETPVWIEDLQIVRHEAQEWLSHLRALPDDHLLGANARERFLAWLDDLLDRCWMRIEGHQPKMIQYVGYPFDLAMFQLARLAASRETIRAHFPDDVYRMYASASFQGGAGWHQMLGWFSSSQEPKPIDDPMIPLLMLSYDRCPDFRICDVGEMQFFIREGDLRAREFSAVQVQMQGG